MFIQIEFRTTFFGQWGTQYTTTISHHKIHLFGGYFFGSNNEIAFIFAIFVIKHDDQEVGGDPFYTDKQLRQMEAAKA